MSLRTRLWLVALLTAGAFVVVAFVAWRLTRATEAFAARQAEWTLHAATGALAGEIRMHPQGRSELPAALSVEPPAPRRPPKPVPPHEREILRRYSDPFERSAAIALHRFPEARGGFLRADGGGTSQSANGGVVAHLTSEEGALVRRLTMDALRSGEATRGEAQTATGRTLFAVVPIIWSDEGAARSSGDEAAGAPVVAAWVRVQLLKGAGTDDLLNAVALALLLLSVSLIVFFTSTTLRALNLDINDMRQGLRALSGDLDAALPAPRTPELQPVAGAINELATDLRRSIEQRQVLQREMARQERFAALGRVVAGVAHEVRNPLAAMRLKMQTTQRAGFPKEKLERACAVVIEEIDRLDSLVRRLLELGRPAALHLVEFDLCELARERAALLAEVAARQQVKISICEAETGARSALAQPSTGDAHAISESNGPCVVSADRERLAQVFDNLFRNALAAMPDDGSLSVNCESLIRQSQISAVRCSVADTGDGIAPAEREHVFEPFYSKHHLGTGLGLAIAREIIEAHGGTIGVTVADGGGALFYFELPQKEGAQSDD